MRKTVLHVTCAGADARVWITSARSPNRCGLLPKKCVNRWEGWMCSHIHKKKKRHTLHEFAPNYVLGFLSVHSVPHTLQRLKV